MIIHELRHEEIGQAQRPRRAEHEESVILYFGLKRGSHSFPIREKLRQRDRVDNGTRKDMRADFRAFFDQADRNLAALLSGKLFQPDGRTQASRPTAHDDHVIFHRLARFRHPMSPPGRFPVMGLL